MGALHIINRATGLASALATAAPEDQVLLIGDAVTAATGSFHRPVYALREDLAERDLVDRVSASVTLTDYPGFVSLVAACQPIVSWR